MKKLMKNVSKRTSWAVTCETKIVKLDTETMAALGQ